MRKFINIITESQLDEVYDTIRGEYENPLLSFKPARDWLKLYREIKAESPEATPDTIATYIADNTEYPVTHGRHVYPDGYLDFVTHWVWLQEQHTIATTPETDDARLVWGRMSPMAHYRLINRLPYLPGNDARVEQAIEYISQHMDEFLEKPAVDRFDNIDDGGIHRLT